MCRRMSDIKRCADSSLWDVRRGNEVIWNWKMGRCLCESRHGSRASASHGVSSIHLQLQFTCRLHPHFGYTMKSRKADLRCFANKCPYYTNFRNSCPACFVAVRKSRIFQNFRKSLECFPHVQPAPNLSYTHHGHTWGSLFCSALNNQ